MNGTPARRILQDGIQDDKIGFFGFNGLFQLSRAGNTYKLAIFSHEKTRDSFAATRILVGHDDPVGHSDLAIFL
jgi:hypothetical protein